MYNQLINYLGVGFICALLMSCTNSDQRADYYRDREVEVFHDILPGEIDIGVHSRASDKLVLLLDDCIGPVISFERDSIRKFTENFRRNFEITDSGDTIEFRRLILILVDSLSKYSACDHKYFTRLGAYDIQLKGEQFDADYVPVGYLALSRVSFNEDFTRSCFYFQYTPYNESRRRVLNYAKKENGKWKVHYSLLFWE